MKDEIVLYQPNEQFQLEVRLQDDTVWLTQQQMAELFQKDRTVITRHINNIFLEGELEEKSNVHFLHFPFSDKPTKIYNLDVIISVGYRVKSQRGTQFRRWATSVLKEYLLRGYAVNQRLIAVEDRIDRRLQEHSSQIHELQNKVDFFVRTSLPPQEGVLFDGQIYDAYDIASRIIRSASKSIVLIDNYVDESVLTLMDKRASNVQALIYTKTISHQLTQDLEKHNAQYAPITIKQFERSHDRFLCIDNIVYHIGASLKDLGKKWFAFNRMEITTTELLEKI